MRPDCGFMLIHKTHENNDKIITASNGKRIVIIHNPYDSFKSREVSTPAVVITFTMHLANISTVHVFKHQYCGGKDLLCS